MWHSRTTRLVLGPLVIMIDLEERSKEESPVSSRVPLRRQLSRKYSYREKSPKYDTIQDNISRADFVLQVNRKFSSLAALYITWWRYLHYAVALKNISAFRSDCTTLVLGQKLGILVLRLVCEKITCLVESVWFNPRNFTIPRSQAILRANTCSIWFNN